MTCGAGNAALPDVVRNTRAILALAGRGDVEVAPGRATPLLRALEVTPETHGPRGLGYAEPPDVPGEPSARFGPDVIVTEARRRPGELTLVTLGPLTNLAVAGPGRACPPAAPAPLGDDGRRLPRPRQHDPRVGVERPLRSRGGAGLPRGVVGGDRRGPGRAADGGDGPRRHRARGPPAGRHRGDRRAAGARLPARAGARRCAAVLLRVPRALRRLLRRVHPRPAGGRVRDRPVADRPDGGGSRRGRRRGRARRRPDDRRLARPDRPAAQRRRGPGGRRGRVRAAARRPDRLAVRRPGRPRRLRRRPPSGGPRSPATSSSRRRTAPAARR